MDFSKNNDYLLLIDTGGSKTHFVLCGADGTTIDEAHCAGVGKSRDDAAEPLPEFCETLARLCGNKKPMRAVANLGGKNELQLKNAVRSVLPRAEVSVFRESSGVLAGLMMERRGANAIVLMGTGVLTVARGPKGSFIADGWGCNIDDVSGGYWIGLEAIRRSLASLETGKALGSLAREITGRDEPFRAADSCEELMTARDEVRAHIGVPLDRAATAAFAKAVARHAAAGDELALDILRDAGSELGRTVVRALGLCGAAAPVRVIIIGGVTAMSDFWGETFGSKLSETFPGSEWKAERTDLIEGALAYALKNPK